MAVTAPQKPCAGTVSTRHSFTVPEACAGLRLDRTLALLHPEWTRSHARRLIDAECVLVAGRAGKPSTVVASGDLIEVDEPEATRPDAAPEAIPLDIVYEDEDILVVNKPAGLVIHPAAGNPSGTLVNALLHHCTDLSAIGGVERPGIVHRLDKDTSGVMVVAKSDSAHQRLSLAFRRRTVSKTYFAVCYGVPEGREGVVEGAIGRHPSERKRMAVVASGRQARTLYEVLETFPGTATLACRPVTGRTHQIRVHMAHAGHALVGDRLYAGRQWRNVTEPAAAAACRAFPRQALHAWRIAFDHPITGARVAFEAPLPDDLRALVETLRGSE